MKDEQKIKEPELERAKLKTIIADEKERGVKKKAKRIGFTNPSVGSKTPPGEGQEIPKTGEGR
ncbi:MAG: hypothetical protein WAX07_02065 [Candidatus Altiarchaeia archaeon]